MSTDLELDADRTVVVVHAGTRRRVVGLLMPRYEETSEGVEIWASVDLAFEADGSWTLRLTRGSDDGFGSMPLEGSRTLRSCDEGRSWHPGSGGGAPSIATLSNEPRRHRH